MQRRRSERSFEQTCDTSYWARRPHTSKPDRQRSAKPKAPPTQVQPVTRKSVGCRNPAISVAAPRIPTGSWAVFDGDTGTKLHGFRDQMPRQIASITKVMTCWVVIQLCWRLNVDMWMTTFEVSLEAASMQGTSAELRLGERFSVMDLLHGLMLPSGNDAAMVLAEGFSSLLGPEQGIQRFVMEMNRWAQIFKLGDTAFTNPHGLGNSLSTASDVGKMCAIVTKDPFVQDIMGKSSYRVEGRLWTNTNKLLGVPGFCGIKTGTTYKAGPCLAAQYRNGDRNIIVVVLSCSSSESRWQEVQTLLKWSLSNN